MLSDEQRARARELWAQDLSIGYIAAALGCSVYDLSPWLYMDDIRRVIAHVRAGEPRR